MSATNYICKIKVEIYKGLSIWKLEHENNYPWHVHFDGKNQDFDNLDEAKRAIDLFQESVNEYFRKRPRARKT